MTLAEVRQAIDRDEDPSNDRKTANGKFERSWNFDTGERLTVVFNREGRATHKDLLLTTAA
jgi:hypothetical protein